MRRKEVLREVRTAWLRRNQRAMQIRPGSVVEFATMHVSALQAWEFPSLQRAFGRLSDSGSGLTLGDGGNRASLYLVAIGRSRRCDYFVRSRTTRTRCALQQQV